jgi:hypothetical protein
MKSMGYLSSKTGGKEMQKAELKSIDNPDERKRLS